MILTIFLFFNLIHSMDFSMLTLRIAQQNVDVERIHMGDMLNAFVFSYDAVPHYWQKWFLQQHHVPPSRDDHCASLRRTVPQRSRTCILQGRCFLCWCRCLPCQRQSGTTRVSGMLCPNDSPTNKITIDDLFTVNDENVSLR